MKKHIATIPKNRREEIRVELSEFNGHDLASLRVYADDGAEFVPTKKGVTVRVGMLPDLAAALRKAENEARAAGLLDGGTGK